MDVSWSGEAQAISSETYSIMLAERLGCKVCTTKIAFHNLTGCDSTRKFGGISSTLKSNAARYLQNYGVDSNNIILQMAEEFLVNVYKPLTKCKKS